MRHYSTPPNPDELYHYGIMGMRWGVRRFQNADGSLTNAGRERYGKGSLDQKRYGIKKDSNGISHGRAKTREDIDNLSGNIAFEGLRIDNDAGRKLFTEFVKSRGVDAKDINYITILGKDMNKAYKLTNDNAYQPDFHITVLSGIPTDQARMIHPRGRWIEDIVNNNLDRENR